MKKIKIFILILLILLINIFANYSNATLAPMSEISIKIINTYNKDYDISFKYKDNISEESLKEIKKFFNLEKEKDEEKSIITFYYAGEYISNSLEKLIIEDDEGNKKEFEIEYKNYNGFNQTTSIIAYEYDAENNDLINKSQEIINKYKIQDKKNNSNHYYKDYYKKDDSYIFKVIFLIIILTIIIFVLKILSKNNKMNVINFLVSAFIIILNFLFYPYFIIGGIIIYMVNFVYQIIKLKKINKLNINTVSLLICETIIVFILLNYNENYTFIAA